MTRLLLFTTGFGNSLTKAVTRVHIRFDNTDMLKMMLRQQMNYLAGEAGKRISLSLR